MVAGRGVTVVQQLVLTPVFVRRYGAAGFGEWGVLSGAVAALGMLNFGVQTYLNQDLAVRWGRGEIAGYRVRSATALRLLLGVIAAALVLGLVVFLLPVEEWLKLDLTRRAAQATAYLLGCQVLLNILNGYLAGIFMGVRMAHRGAYWNNFQALLTSLCLLLAVVLRMPFPVLAGVQVCTMLTAIGCVLADLKRTAPEVFPTLGAWDGAAVKDILKPSGYFGLLTMCTFLAYQAPLVVIERALGPVAVAGFIVMRLVFSMCRQMLAIFTQSMGAEITALFGRGDWPGLSRLYDYSERFIFFLIPVVNTAVLLGSPVVIALWMHRRAELFSPYPYVLAAAISMVISLKEHKYQFQFSTNTHESLARIMFFSYLAMVVVSVGAVRAAGVVGFLWVWLATECVQMVRIVRLNVALFRVHERLEMIYLQRLVGMCAVSLVGALLLLRRTSGWGMGWQAGLAVGVGVVLTGVSWRVFRVGAVARQMGGRLRLSGLRRQAGTDAAGG